MDDNFDYGTPLKGLNRQEGAIRELQKEGYDLSYLRPEGTSFSQEMDRQLTETPAREYVGVVGLNDSMFDEDITSFEQLEDLNNARGELQPWYLQAAAGVAKGGVLALTTMADGILGTIVGLGYAAATGNFSRVVDNPVSNALQAVNEWSEKVLPNYYTNAEKEGPWYNNVFSANFIADKFIKNLGFSVGAVYGGMPVTKGVSAMMGFDKARKAFKGAVAASGASLTPEAAINAYRRGDMFLDGVKLTDELIRDAKRLRIAEPTLKLTGAFTGAIGEGRIEGLSNSNDWFNLHKQQLDAAYQQVKDEETQKLLDEFPQYGEYIMQPDGSYGWVLNKEGEAIMEERANARFNYNEGLEKLSIDRAKMANVDFLLNVPLLTFGDIWQFGKLYAGGFRTAKKAGNILRNVAEDGTMSYTVAKASVGRKAARFASNALVEGAEEGNQAVISTMAGEKYASELNDFYGAKIDPEAEAETISWMKALGKGIAQTYGKTEGWEEVFIGGLTGLVGVPMFRSARNQDGRFQSPVYIQGGIRDEIKEMREEREREDAITTQLNNRVQSPEFLNYYQSAIRHNKYQRDMDAAAENNDNFEFKNAEHNQLINDVIMFNNAGRISDLYELIEEAGTIKPEDVEQIRQLTTNQETGTSVYDGMTDEEVVSQIQRQAQDMKAAVDRYRQISEDLQVKLGDVFEGDELEEMTYLFSNIDNLEGRFKEVFEDIKSTLTPVINELGETTYMRGEEEVKASDILKLNPSQLIAEFAANHSEISKLLNTVPEDIKNRNRILKGKIKDAVEAYKSTPTSGRKGYVTKLLNQVDALQTEVDKLTASGVIVDGESLNDKITDLIRIADRRLDFIDKYTNYIYNPKELKDKQDSQRNVVSSEGEKQQTLNMRDKLSKATNFQEFREAINQEIDTEKRQKLLDEMINENNPMAKSYKESQSYYSQISDDIEGQNIPEQVKKRAMDMFNQLYDSSSSLNDIANPEASSLNNPEVVFDELLDEEQNYLNFAETQYVLHSAMNRVNNANEFKDRFPREFLKPVEKVENSKGSPIKDVTGDSQTSTVTPANDGPVNIPVPPVGDVSIDSIIEENKEENGQSVDTQQYDTKQIGQRKYYRPAIPELHIQGSKEGDFRPFNVIAAEREQGVNFDAIYSYLRDNGAFSTVNTGNLRIGDELGFMIDPEFNDKTIFIVDNKTHQIVGSLDESDYSVARYEGLKELSDKIRREYQGSRDKTSKFFATPVTRVSKIMVGKVPLTNEERELAIIPGVSKDSIFGIIRNGVLNTNGRLPNNLVLKPQNMSNKEGRMYILIPNAAGTYSPAAIRVKHFNEKEFNPKNATINSTPLYKNLNKAIKELASARTNESVSEAVSNLARSLYIGDVHIDLQGKNLRLTKIQRDKDGKEIYDIHDGKRLRREDSKVVTLMDNKVFEEDDLFVIGPSGEIQTEAPSKNVDQVAQDIENVLMSFNLPLQVSIGMLNQEGYNAMLLNSNVLTSNINEAAVKSSWFITDYFDIDGNLQQAFNPGSSKVEIGESPVGGLESAIAGTPVEIGKETYHVDLTSNTVRNSNGQMIKSYPESLFDMAYAQSNFGNKQNGSTMINGIILLPNGKVLNRNTGKYLTGNDAEKFKRTLIDRQNAQGEVKRVIDEIVQDQQKVDKGKTDSEFYYIMEEDGSYHEYNRVHSVIGSNWVQSEKQTEALNGLRANLSKQADNVQHFNNYLKNLSNHYKVDLNPFIGKTDLKSRDTIINIIRDVMSGTKSQRSLEAGSSVDSVIRNFFTSKEMPSRPDNITEQAFNDLVTSLTEIKSNIEARGEQFITNNVVLFHKYKDGTRVAGEVDILAVDSEGNFKIYDVKTSRYSFYDFIDKKGKKINYFKNKSNTQKISQEDYYTLQLSAYKNLFETSYSYPVSTLAILPFVLEYESKDSEKVSRITKEKGIPVKYNPGVSVPLEGAPIQNPKVTEVTTPILNSSVELIEEPETNLSEDYEIKDGKVGYYIIDDKIYRGYVAPVGEVAGVEIHMTKIPLYSRGIGNSPQFIAKNQFYAIFPNGKTFKVTSAPTNHDDTFGKNKILEVLSGNPKRVQQIASEKTSISSLEIGPQKEEIKREIITPANMNQGTNTASSLINKMKAIDKTDSKFEEDILLRETTNEPYKKWNKETEEKWLKQVLPQLSKSDRYQVIKGLIRVGDQGTIAWGKFSDGIITLSDIAKEGTLYHEAFHAVFNLQLSVEEREELFKEARKMYGNKSQRSLEEDMAEGFRDYIMTRDNRGIGEKILDFFRNLFTKITNWNSIRPSLTELYQRINEGKYKEDTITDLSFSKEIIQNTNWMNVSESSRQSLQEAGWTAELFDSISQEERNQALRCL